MEPDLELYFETRNGYTRHLSGRSFSGLTNVLPAQELSYLGLSTFSSKIVVPRQESNLLVGLCNLVKGKPENLVAMNGVSNILNFKSTLRKGKEGFALD